MTLDIHNWSSSVHQKIHKIVKDEIFPIVNQVDARVQNFEIQFLKEAAKFVRDFKSLTNKADESLAKHKDLEFEIERLLRGVVSQDIMSIVQNPTVFETSDLQTELERTKERFENCIIKKENEYAKLWNENQSLQTRIPSASKSSCSKNKEVEVEVHPRNLLLSKNKKHMSSECNNIKLVIRNEKSKVVCAIYKQCLITSNHDVYVLNYVNDMNSRVKKINANVSNTTNKKKHKPKVLKPEKVGSKERLASPKPRKPRTCLRWSPTGRIFNLKGKIIKSSESESQSDYSNGDNACTPNPQEPTSKRFTNSTFYLAGHSNLFMARQLGMLKAHDRQSEASYKFRLEVLGSRPL
ncbi:hypothetical protein Tco_1402383 [Tanacetum coccineum]